MLGDVVLGDVGYLLYLCRWRAAEGGRGCSRGGGTAGAGGEGLEFGEGHVARQVLHAAVAGGDEAARRPVPGWDACHRFPTATMRRWRMRRARPVLPRSKLTARSFCSLFRCPAALP